MPAARILLLMGVAGSGKTTVGRQLAAALDWPYHEADDFHSAANRDKMGRGLPLDDADRAPWLAALRAAMDASLASG
ncbi:MAG TPA: shikimate kinase, partial [Lacunisphaera sp.]|nr:shikimate kinase [Lacunisphaera sp.]